MIELFGRLIRWFVRFIGGLTLLRLVLLSLTLVSVEQGLIAIVGHILPDWLISTAVYGILIGWVLGRSRLTVVGSLLAALVIGLVWLIMSIGQMSAPVDLLLTTLPPILRLTILGIPPKVRPLMDAWTALIQSFGALSSRLILWLRNAGTSTLIIDPGITSLVWGLVLWLVSTWAAWWVRRRESLGIGLLPATTLLIYNVYYTNSRNGIVWLVLTGGGWIILQAADSFLKASRRWQQHRMGQTEIEPLLAGAVVLLASGFMLAGGLLPSFSIQKLSDSLQQLFHGQQDKALAESLGLQQTPEVIPLAGIGEIGLSATHAVGPGPHLSQDVIMYVTVDGYVPPPPTELLLHYDVVQSEVRYYWRSQVYDVYNGHVWVANTSRTQDIAANNPYHPNLKSLPENLKQIHQHVERLMPMNVALFVTGDLLSTDQPSIADWRAAGDLIDARTNSGTYTADSLVQVVSVEQLRSAGNNYPDSVHNYLALPDGLPGRVRDLAVRLTFNQPTPYDQVMAIQTYLRQFPYSLDVPGAPTNRDVADYFLFDLQKGYCDYFATTMAVMVRAVGIPSRLVTGYSSGTYDYNAHHFVVVQSNAHSWVEVYFPGIGWVEFEPTTNQQPFSRPGEMVDQANPSVGIPTPVPPVKTGAVQINWLVLRKPLTILEFTLVGLILIALGWRLLPLESWLLTLRPADKAITTIHQRLYRLGRALGVASNAARTPHEFANAFSLKMERYAGNKRLAPVTVAINTDVNLLTDLYTRLLFSPHPPTPEEHQQAIRNWARIRKGLRKVRYS